jgi:hypothetical protein
MARRCLVSIVGTDLKAESQKKRFFCLTIANAVVLILLTRSLPPSLRGARLRGNHHITQCSTDCAQSAYVLVFEREKPCRQAG